MDFWSEVIQRLVDSSIMHRALLGGTFIALVAPILGVFLVLRRYALFAEGIGHIVFGGIGFAFFMGWNPIWTALGTAVLGALGIEQVRAQRRLSGDMAIAVFLTLGLGSGILFARLGGVSSGVIERYLFGSLATIRTEDVWLAGIIAVILLVVMSLIGKELFAITFDEESAQAGGISVHTLNRFLTVLAALVLVASIQITGVLLASAMIVFPTAASLQLARSFVQALVLAVVFGLLMVNIGLLIAYFANWVPSGAIVCTGALFFGLASVVKWIAYAGTGPVDESAHR